MYEIFIETKLFQHDMAYRDFKDLLKRTAAGKVLRDKTFNIVKILKYDGYQRGLHWLINLLIKSILVVVLKVKLFQTKN